MRIKPFKALRPVTDKAAQVASRPYDVLNSEEARIEAGDNPWSFLRVVKPEITLPPGTDPYSPQVYAAGRENFRKMVDDGIFFQDEQESLYIYELVREGRSQTGIVACAWVEDYTEDRIMKHELTRPDKELDRVKHIRISMMNAEPVFLAFRSNAELDAVVEGIKKSNPVYDFSADDGVAHRLWVVKDQDAIGTIVAGFEKVPVSYVADGHHRTAAAARVAVELRDANTNHSGAEEYNYILAVHFPADQLRILDYNRVVKDLNGLGPEQFIKRLSASFKVDKKGIEYYKPRHHHEIGMYLDHEWYALEAHADTYDDDDPIGVLDNTILSQQILGPILNITDLRGDKRIDFVGGIRGLDELRHRVDSGEMSVAFAMFPVSMEQLLNIADTGNIMPPKSTWFEPKLRSGLFVHSLQEKK